MASQPPKKERQPSDDVQQYIEELRKNSHPRETIIFGMVKPAEGTDGLMFAHTGDCESWIFIPAVTIRTIRSAGRVQCGGRFYTLAEIHLDAPQSELEKTYALVGDLHRVKLAQYSGDPSISGPPSTPCPAGFEWSLDQWGNWDCLPKPTS